MKKYIGSLSVTVLLLTLSSSALVEAATSTDLEDEMSYEDIVKDLSQEKRAADSSSRAQYSGDSRNSIDDVMIHGGIGITQMFGAISANGHRTHLSQRGIQATLGIDLFSENWLAEGSARNFSPEEYGATKVSLKEFDLKVLYRNQFAPKLGLKLGGGLAARYMTVNRPDFSQDYTTPASVFTGGLELLAARNLTVGAEMGYRSAMVNDTIDKNSYDMTLRVDANF